MTLETAVEPAPPALRHAAYTSPRPDVSALIPANAARVLDVGCSNGALGRSLKAACPQREVWGIEFDAGFAAQARLRLDHVIQADLNCFDWAAGLGPARFDCIVFADVLEHLAWPADCLAQALRHLAANGHVVVSLPNVRHVSVLKSIFFDGSFPRRDRGIFDRTHLRWFTIKDAHALLHDCGLAVVDTSYSLRWGDRGGGRMNRALNRSPQRLRQWGLLRELLTYQMCLRAAVRR